MKSSMIKISVVDAVSLAAFMLAMRLDEIVGNKLMSGNTSLFTAHIAGFAFEALAALIIPAAFVLILKITGTKDIAKASVMNIPVMLVLAFVVNILLRGILPLSGGLFIPNLRFAFVYTLSHIILSGVKNAINN